jgi:hypothetical protein
VVPCVFVCLSSNFNCNIEEAKERYIRQLDVLNDFESNIEFSEMGSSDKEEIDCDVDTVLADIAKWSYTLRPI